MAESGPVLVLIGAPASGKSRIGKRIAKLLDVPFVDTDKTIVAEHGVIAAIFEQHGEPHFRAIERVHVQRALHQHAVVALGGGAVLDPATQADLEPLLVAQLTVHPSAVAGRNLGANRPLLVGGIDAWTRLVAERAPLYDRLADASFDTSSLSAERVASDIAAWVRGESA